MTISEMPSKQTSQR